MGLIANISAAFVRVRDEINLIKTALQNVSGAQAATYTVSGVARAATTTEVANSNAVLIVTPERLRDYFSSQATPQIVNQVNGVLSGYALNSTWISTFVGNGTQTDFYPNTLNGNLAHGYGSMIQVFRKVVLGANAYETYYEKVMDSELNFIRVYFEDPNINQPYAHIQFVSAPPLNQEFVLVNYYIA
jgi:hypothetical protein